MDRKLRTLRSRSSVPTAAAENTTTIDSLPPEIKREIFKQIESKTELRLVCSAWRNKVDSWFFKHSGILTDDSVSFIRNSSLQFDTITVKNLHKDLSSEKLKTTRSCTRSGLALNPRKLIFTYYFRDGILLPLTSVSTKNIKLLLLLNTDIESLVFNHSVFSHTKLNLDGLYFPNLTELEIKLDYDSNSFPSNQKSVFHYISKLKLPSLTTMKIRVNDSTDENKQLYIDIYELIASCKKSLKNLHVFFEKYFYEYLNNTLPLGTSHVALLHKDLSQIRLESLCIILDNFEDPDCRNLALSLLSSQHTLKNLKVCITVVTEERFAITSSLVKRTIEQNSSSLVNLTMRLCEYLYPVYIIPDATQASLLRSMFESLISITTRQAKLESLSLYDFLLTLAPTNLSTFINLSNLPPSIKSLTLMGGLDPSIFHALASSASGIGTSCLPLLEELVIYNTDGNREKYSTSKVYLNKILNLLPKLKVFKIKCCVNNFKLMDFQSTNQSLKIGFA